MNCTVQWEDFLFFRSRSFPDREAIYDYEEQVRYTYKDLETRANLLANYLSEKFQISKGDRIAFCTRNRIELFDAFYAASKLGFIITTYNPFLSAQELMNLVHHEKPKVLFYEEKWEDKINQLKPSVDIEKYVIIGNSSTSQGISYQTIMDYNCINYRKSVITNLEETLMIIHTGGTTGTPKGAMISYRAVLYNIFSEIMTFQLSGCDSLHLIAPMFHTASWNVLTLPILCMGGRIILSRQFNPQLALKILEEEKPTVYFGVPTMYRLMMEHPDFEKTDFSSLRWAISGGAPTSSDIINQYSKKNVIFSAAYGMTEAGPSNLSFPIGDHTWEEIQAKRGSAGKPMAFNEVKIIDDKGQEVEVGEYGELIWKGPLVFTGYWNNLEETAKALCDGWMHSGDIAKKDKDGFYYVIERKKNMFITGGENIYPIEIEKEISKHPAVREVCVFGIPDYKWGEVGKAIIVLNKGYTLTKKEVKEFLIGKLGSIKIPSYIQIVDEIPRNDVGKTQMKKIRKLYGEQQKGLAALDYA